HYMSPEQARAPKSADARSDIWSLGVVLYELVLGERPFRGETPVAILASLLSDQVPEITPEQRPRMPEELMAVIRRCLERDPDRRFSHVAEFARALLPMATPSSEQVVLRIESMARTTPVVDTPPEQTAPMLRHTHGSTLVSARSSLIGATSSTHSLDPQRLPMVQRRFGAKALALLAGVAVLSYWVASRAFRGHPEVDSAPSAQIDVSPKRDQPGETKHAKQPPGPAPSASVEVSPVASAFDAKASASGVPTVSAAPTASVAPTASAPPRSDRKLNARTQPEPSVAVTSSPSTVDKGRPISSGPPRPRSTADPINHPE
ncbi:MAG TPA: protein kinase, partial [Polyangiaceae bacterium]